jgi:cobaltochelatase CobS
MNRHDLEALLGPPSAFIITEENSHLVQRWALLCGFEAVQVHSMNNVALANLYCAHVGQSDATPVQQESARNLIAAIEAVRNNAVIDFEAVRVIVREELTAYPPQRLEVTSPRGVAMLEGIVHYRTPLVIKIASIGHAVMLVGPAGCGKTTIGEHVAKALQLPFYITSTVNHTHELIGFVDGYGKYHETSFRHAYEHGGVWIADEIDAWDANALLTANSALANGFITFPDQPLPISRHVDFRMIATANTFGTGADRVYIGRNELDAASLDRFATIDVDYDLDLERMFANGDMEWLEHIWNIRRIVDEKMIRHVVNSRAIAMGVAALNIGIKLSDVEEIYLYKGMSEKDRSKIEKELE